MLHRNDPFSKRSKELDFWSFYDSSVFSDTLGKLAILYASGVYMNQWKRGIMKPGVLASYDLLMNT